MAVLTKQLGGLGPDVRFELDYDDRKLLLVALRCINNSDSAAWGQAVATANGRTYGMRFPPGQTTEVAIPTGPQQKLDITIDAQGRLDGVEYSLMAPYP